MLLGGRAGSMSNVPAKTEGEVLSGVVEHRRLLMFSGWREAFSLVLVAGREDCVLCSCCRVVLLVRVIGWEVDIL